MKQKSHKSDDEKIRDFQNKLYLKAKQAKDIERVREVAGFIAVKRID